MCSLSVRAFTPLLHPVPPFLPLHQTKNVLIPRASHNFDFFAEVCTRMDGHTYRVVMRALMMT